MSDFRVVPDSLREREPLKRGRPPRSEMSRKLLEGQTIFYTGPKKKWGQIYKLAKNHNKQAHIKTIIVNGDEGTLIWLDD